MLECKSGGAKPKLWVAIDSSSAVYGGSTPGDLLSLCLAPDDAEVPDQFTKVIGSENFEGTLLGRTKISHSIVQSFSASEGRSSAWDAVRQATAAARGYVADAEVKHPDRHLVVMQPVVVTGERLFRAWYQDGDLKIKDAQRVSVTQRLHGSPRQVRCIVVTEEGVDQLAIEARATAERLASQVKRHGGLPRDPSVY